MGLKNISGPGAFEAHLQQAAAKIDTLMLNYLRRLGELCLIECRTNKTYMDQTGNLTASMGYVITRNGQVVSTSGFGEQVGGVKGASFARQKAWEHPSGWVLIVVAGMDYAYAVETRGYNVLSSAELLAEKKLPSMIAQLKRMLK